MGSARLVRAFALVLLAWQAMVVQAHWDARPTAATIIAAAPGASAEQPRHDNALDCPICRAISHAGAYLSPAGTSFGLADLPHELAAAPALTPLDLSQPSHAWRSRAPPVPLPA